MSASLLCTRGRAPRLANPKPPTYDGPAGVVRRFKHTCSTRSITTLQASRSLQRVLRDCLLKSSQKRKIWGLETVRFDMQWYIQ